MLVHRTRSKFDPESMFGFELCLRWSTFSHANFSTLRHSEVQLPLCTGAMKIRSDFRFLSGVNFSPRFALKVVFVSNKTFNREETSLCEFFQF
jgi:hypothetical protein